jgi:hypothetical protein
MPNAIHTRLKGQIQSSGKNPVSRRKSGTQINGELVGMQMLAIMLSIQRRQAEPLQIFFFVHLPAAFSIFELCGLLSRVHFLDGVHQPSSLFGNILNMLQASNLKLSKTNFIEIT